MRTKKVKAAYETVVASDFVKHDKTFIDVKNHLQLEIGSGKGKFITELALLHPEITYIAYERDINVCYRIVEKQTLLKLPNLIIIQGDAIDLPLYFKPNSIDKIYLNFSDPWPKTRHHKRRLVHPVFLNQYITLLKPNGQIEFRTDHDSLYLDSLEYIKECPLELLEQNEDCMVREAQSEYEMKKRLENPIKGWTVRVKK